MPNESGNTRFVELRDELLEQLIQNFGSLPEEEAAQKEYERIHLLTGFTIFSDWIGSNADWFTQKNAADLNGLADTTNKVLDKLLWNTAVRDSLKFGQLFVEPGQPDSFQPREIQTALLKSAQSPGLYIVEAPMGMGKTEAALAAAYQRWTTGEERGLYFALPTQLTSAKIHDRVNNFLKNVLGAESFQPLIHSNAWLDEKPLQLLSPAFIEADAEHPEQDENDTNEALRWYSTTRRQLIAPFGTGTIDQALLAILPARFAALRYFALAGKVVIIDEVHSFDPYMSALIDRLIRFLIKAGSTVIILSATLTASRRAELVKAAGAEEAATPQCYPLITKVATGSQHATHIKLSGNPDKKQVQLKHETLESDRKSDCWESIAQKVEAGANVVVIRNTVALAQHTYRCLKSRLSSRIEADRIGLLHSRFPQNMRRTKEENWTESLGKDKAKRPKGSLLVSTQIVEQSVDIDADYLVTDLAPVDLILQRIGRLHRHSHERPAGFETAICHILHPNTDWQGSLKEVKEALKPHHHIYPALSLWQAAETLSDLKTILLPDDIRSLLEEATTLSPSSDSSAALLAFAADYARKRDEMASTAKLRNIFNAAAIEDKEGRETRYGVIPTAQLIILPVVPIEQGGRVRLELPDCSEQTIRIGEFSYPLAKTLHAIATRIPAYLVKPQLREAPDWLSQHIEEGVIAISSKDTNELNLYASQEIPYRLHYNDKLGVWYEKNETIPTDKEPEDFWY